ILVNPLLANSRLGERIHVEQSGDVLRRIMTHGTFIVEFVSRHAGPVAATGILLTVMCTVAGIRLIPGDRLSTRVPQSSEAWEAMRHCDSEFGGVRSVHLVVRWSEGTMRKDIWEIVRRCEQILEEEGVGPVSSIRTALTVYGVPNAKDRSILVSQLPADLRERFYRKDLSSTLVAGRLKDADVESLGGVFDRIETKLQGLARDHSGFEVKLVSDIIVESRVVRQIIEELMESLLAAAFIIFGVLAVSFRSLRIGLISIVPNIMPLAIAAAIRLLINDSLGIAGACSFAICLGIAVDDTIHYLSHFQRERAKGCTAVEANRHTFVYVGSALMMTTLVMTSGLATVLISRLPPHVNFAAMGCATLAAALPADLLVLPALLSLFPGRKPSESAEQTHGAESGEITPVESVGTLLAQE
ncbi:MAG: MMPL family transporter, partial [Fuerstiella sp.]|nr:MMPL family transporter [Fuerstiella sp.]